MGIMAQIEESIREFCDWEWVHYLFDVKYVHRVYSYVFHRRLHWFRPTRFTDKLHKFKISREAEALAPYADKYAVRAYVAATIGEKYLVPLIGVYDGVDEIDTDQLPERFVLKATHGSGWNIICTDKKKFDWEEAKEKLSAWLSMNFYKETRERQYKNITPRIVSEEFLDEGPEGLTDYKLHCFKGKVYCIRVQAARAVSLRKSFYDVQWNEMSLNLRKNPRPPVNMPRPKNFEEMLFAAEKLSQPFPYVRVDMYNVNGQVYFGELTFTPNNGQDKFDPDSADETWGAMLPYYRS